MANIVNVPNVLVLDTTADNIVAATVGVRIRKLRLVAAAAASTAQVTEAGGSVTKAHLSCGANVTDTLEFYASPLNLAGLKVTLSGAGALLYVYTEMA